MPSVSVTQSAIPEDNLGITRSPAAAISNKGANCALAGISGDPNEISVSWKMRKRKGLKHTQQKGLDSCCGAKSNRTDLLMLCKVMVTLNEELDTFKGAVSFYTTEWGRL